MSNYPPAGPPPGRDPARDPGRSRSSSSSTGRNTRPVEPLGSAEESGRSETRDRIFGALAAVVGVALVVLAVFAMTGSLGSKAEPTDAGAAGQNQPSDPAAEPTEEAPPASDPAAEPPPATQELDPNAKAPLTVLNASSVGGLAGDVAATYEAAGWLVNEVGNLPEGNVQVTTVYYTEGNVEEQAAATALQTQFPQIQQVAVRPATISFQGVVVVLTGDYKI